MADRLRKYVRWGLEDAKLPIREDLFADDQSRRPLSWHDLRHTGIPWRAVRGDDPIKIQRAAGHSDFAMTSIYIKEAQTFEDAQSFGEPFPAIDVAALTSSANWAGIGLRADWLRWNQDQIPAVRGRPRRDSNPC